MCSSGVTGSTRGAGQDKTLTSGNQGTMSAATVQGGPGKRERKDQLPEKDHAWNWNRLFRVSNNRALACRVRSWPNGVGGEAAACVKVQR